MKKLLAALCCLGLTAPLFAQFSADGTWNQSFTGTVSGSFSPGIPEGIPFTNSSVTVKDATTSGFYTSFNTVGAGATGNRIVFDTVTGSNVTAQAAQSTSVDGVLPSGVVSGNSVTVKNSTFSSGDNVFAGASSHGNQANNNTLTFDNSTVVLTSGAYGGYSELGTNFGKNVDPEEDISSNFDPEYNYSVANGNAVYVLNGSVIQGTLGGGLSVDLATEKSSETATNTKSTAVDNRVVVDASTVTGPAVEQIVILGGNGGVYSNNNTVEIRNGSTVEGIVVGASTESAWTSGSSSEIYATANDNKVLVSGSTVTGEVFASYTDRTHSAGNTVVVESTQDHASSVTGNIAAAKSIYGKIIDATSGEETLAGVATQHANNTVSIAGTEANKVTVTTSTNTDSPYTIDGGFIAGSWNEAGNTKNNTVTISHANITGGGAVVGGFVVNEVQTPPAGSEDSELKINAIGHRAEKNTVSISDSTLTADVYGGYVKYVADANPPEGGAAEERGIDRASGNTIVLNNADVTGDVYGGRSERPREYVDADGNATTESFASNNTVVVSGSGSVSGTVYGGLVGDGSADSPTYYSGNTFVFNHYTGGNEFSLKNFNTISIVGNDSNVVIAEDASASTPNYAFFTLDGKPANESKEIATTPVDFGIYMQQDALGAYAYTLTSVASGTTSTWTLTGGFSQELAKPYAQAALAGLVLTTVGDDKLSEVVSSAFESLDDNNTFLGGEYAHRKYKTGSHFDMDSAVAQAGYYHKFTDSTLGGLFAQYAFGDYETSPAASEGKINTYSAGAFAAWNYSETGRLIVDGRIGTQQTRFNSFKLSSDFKMNAMFWGIGGGFVEKFDSFDVYGRLNYARRGGESKTDNLGQSIELGDASSMLGKFGANYNLPFLLWKFQPFVGAAAIYQFSGEPETRVDGNKVDNTDIKGLSGEARITFAYDNQDPLLPLKTGLSIFGTAGQMKGFGVDVKVMMKF